MPDGRPLRNGRFLPYRRLRRQAGSGGVKRDGPLHSPLHDVDDALVDRLIQDHLNPEDLLLNTRPDPNEEGAAPEERT